MQNRKFSSSKPLLTNVYVKQWTLLFIPRLPLLFLILYEYYPFKSLIYSLILPVSTPSTALFSTSSSLSNKSRNNMLNHWQFCSSRQFFYVISESNNCLVNHRIEIMTNSVFISLCGAHTMIYGIKARLASSEYSLPAIRNLIIVSEKTSLHW